MSNNLLANIEMAPKDPILGITEAFNADKNPHKVNLGVGVYTDENGKVPLLECVKQAETLIHSQQLPRGYQPIEGMALYNKEVQALVFGSDSEAIQEERIVSAQALGGTGGLKLGADFLQRFHSQAEVLISDPSWENHRALFESAGFKVNTYPYYDAKSHGVNFSGMIEKLNACAQGTIIVLHACCHNPSGVDLTDDQWHTIIDIVKAKNLVPFLDLAYQGFSKSIDEDGLVIKKFVAAGLVTFVSNSFSKSFSLYGERIGAFHIACQSKEEAGRVLSQLKRVIRTNYSNPPAHGAQIVATVLGNAELRALWEKELGAMRNRIKEMRVLFVNQLKESLPQHDFSFVAQQNGMFSFSGLTKEQVHQLRDNYSVYAVDSGRICVAALNKNNMNAVIAAITGILK
ncbi:MAG: aromatic amino acid aminotransferase [Ferrovum sp. 37-45-19]|nr:aspartate aminotransferase [Ferrovum sp. JA12]OYV79236.1 MAG: aromatic amino acid aminotransferase [Ferrovum sp. 21-44-67]OYV93865.1 MAG: aromatic amino acid aminotransferase [Ferrovum sp. 37-45-19]OZB32161.1 MAG: aromatic amino acid aminotransferase [Ferrovum sp. 34-44-207]